MGLKFFLKLMGRNHDNLPEKPKNVYPTNEEFLRLPLLFYNTVGLAPFDLPSVEKKPEILFHLYFVLHMVNLTFVVAMQILFVAASYRNKEHFVEACEEISYIGFITAGVLKFFPAVFQKRKMVNLVRTLEDFFPPPREKEQKQYVVSDYLKRCHRICRGFGGLWTSVVATNSMFALIQYLVLRLLRSPSAKQSLPYVDYAPWDYKGGWRFYLTYMSQAIAGYSATCGHISADLMVFAVTMQAIMHFDRLSRALTEFQVRAGSGAEKDLKELRSLIGYHNQILGLADVMNEVFGIPLLVNFAASSMLACFLGLQMVVSLSALQVCKLLLSLVAPTVEIYLLCSMSQMLIDASENVSFAAYDMNWTDADPRFRKMLIFLAFRAQQPVCLKATVLVNVSIETMSIYLRLTYTFFCAITTMYQ